MGETRKWTGQVQCNIVNVIKEGKTLESQEYDEVKWICFMKLWTYKAKKVSYNC